MITGDELGARCEALLVEAPPATTSPEEFLGKQFDAGLAWVHHPDDLGGLNGSKHQQQLVDGLLHRAGAPVAIWRNVIGIGMAAPTLMVHGTPEQQRRHLRPLFTAEEVWCQLFSEPTAGSDVASLATRAVRDGDEWVVNGQKVWTSLAHLARWGLLAARTAPEQPKHRGITYFVVDMTAPGVEVRPLFQITGEAEFNEVFFNDLRLPSSAVLGDVGAGWSVILTTLMNERVAIGGGVPPRGGGFIAHAVDLWHKHGGTDVQRDRLADLWIKAEVLRLTNIRASQNATAGTPGPEGSIGKILSANLNKDISEFAVDLLGPFGAIKPDGFPMTRPQIPEQWVEPVQAFLRARGNSIEGGTTEIAKNIVGERVLGLPGDIRVDKDLPWSEVPRS